MGYRSEGKLYLSDKAKQLLPNELRQDLIDNWEKEEDGIYSFSDWKWYSSYEDIIAWESFIRTLSNYSDWGDDSHENPYGITDNDWDIVIVGEDGAVYDGLPQTFCKFCTYTVIEVC